MRGGWVARNLGWAGAALAWATTAPVSGADNSVYVPAYNSLAASVNMRIPYSPGVNALAGKAPLDKVSQVDLERIRNSIRTMMTSNFRLAPQHFNLSVVSDETFPLGLRYSGGTLVKPSLMDGIGDGEGRFTKIPAEYTQSGQTVYAESFTDAPVLWIHFLELQEAISRMRYILIQPGAKAAWTANGEANERHGYGTGVTPAAAVAKCEANYAVRPHTALNDAPGAVASIIAPAYGSVWEAAVVRRYAYFKLSKLSTSISHKAWFYRMGKEAAPAMRFQAEYDDNGTGCVEGRWQLWSTVDGGFSSNVLSSAFGDGGAIPVWCDAPVIMEGWRNESWRGYECNVVAVMKWDFPDKELKRPDSQDPEEDGLADIGCGCSSCPLETAASWAGVQPQAKVVIPLGVSDGLLSGGLRVKSYMAEYEINGYTQQMYSLGSRVIWTTGADNSDWQFICVRRPSGAEVAFSTRGAAAGRTVDAAHKYRVEKNGALVKLRFPGAQREIVHEFTNNLLTAVCAKTGRKELRVEVVGGNWPGMSGVAELVGVWRMKQVNSSLLEAKMGYVNGLVRSVEYRYRSGQTNKLVYYEGSKGFRNLDENGQITWDTRVVTDTSNGAVEIWSGITTNGGLRVARKERRRAWDDAETGLSMVEQTEVAESGGLPAQTRTTLFAVASFPWGDETVSETVGAGCPEARTTRYTYYADPEDSNNYSHLERVENPDGAWTRYAYDPLGREQTIQSGFKDARVGDTLACRTTENFYSGDPALGPLNMPADDQVVTNDSCPRLIVGRLAGQEVARTYHSYQTGRETIVNAVRRAAAYDDPGNLVTVTTFVTSGNFKGRPLRIDRPGGDFSVFAYSYDTGRKELTTTEDSGTGPGGVVTNGTRTVTVSDVAQRTLRESTVDIASGIEVMGTANTLDWLGRAVCASNRVDGTVSLTQYGCCGPEAVRDTDGISTTYDYDELKRLYASERLGVTTFHSYDVFGNVVESRRSGNGESDIVASSQYDQVDRLVRTVDERGFATTCSYATNAAGEPRVMTVFPDGSTMVETSYPDGQPKSVTGAAVRAVCYDYGVDERGAFTVVYEGADTNALQWTKTYVDMLGRESLVLYPDGYRKETVYDTAGRPVRQADGLTTRLTAYNGKGEAFRSAVDLDGDEVMDLTGPDRVTESEAGCGVLQGKNARWMEARDYEVAGSGLPSVIRGQWQSVDGTVAWDIAFGRTGRVEVVRQPETAARRETTFHPDGTRTVSCFTNGLLQCVRRESSTGQLVAGQAFSYDVFGRLDAREETGPGGGTVQSRYRYDAGGRVTNETVTAGGLVRMTTYQYDAMGRRIRTVLPDGGEVACDYEPTGELRAQSGSRTYPRRYGYDERGRLTALETFRSGTNAAPDVTRWEYDARRGWQTTKVYADGRSIRHDYRADGKTSKRVGARGIETVYEYDAAGGLTNVAYSDGTPGVEMTLDRLGRPIVVQDGTGLQTNVYGADGVLTREILPGATGELRYENDALGRRTNLQVRGENGEVYRVGYQYDEAGRLFSVGAGDTLMRYKYGGDARTVTGMVVAVGGAERLRGTRQYDSLGRLERAGWMRGTDPLVGVEYGHNAADLQSRCTALDGSYWTYEYDELGQMVAGRKFTAVGVPVADAQYEYDYDLIGNRDWATDGAGRRFSYRVNEVNQYTEMSIPGLIRAVVWSGTVFTFGSGPSGVASRRAGSRQVEPQYDADGNLTDDGRFSYAWDGENRLILISNLQSRISFSYDYLSRRVRKSVFTNTSDSSVLTSDFSFVYDGWNLISEVGTAVPSGPSFTNSYVWGLDLSGTLQGAGGIGGLLSFSRITSNQSPITSFYAHDGNGNVTDLVDSNGTPVAHYDYDPFGTVTAMTGVESTNNPFRFSTKYADQETGLIYYGYRYYSPATGRWISRDPIGEAGGMNVYGFVGNAPISGVDPLGLALYAFDGTGADYETWTHVSILHRSYVGIAHYKEGVGSRWYSSIVGGTTGFGGTVRLEDMYRLLVETYKKGDKDIDIIGFSRGASLAREFANMVYEKGIVDTTYRWERNDRSGQYNRVVDSRNTLACSPKIRFVGLFDTVGSFGIVGNDINIGIRMGLPPNVEHAAQAIARDERRSQFPLTPLNAPSASQQFSQQVFPGDHSDIGGGHEKGQNLLAHAPLFYIWSKGREAGAPFGSLDLMSDQDQWVLEVAGERRPWAYQSNKMAHDLTTSILYTDGGVRKNLPGGSP